MKQLSMVDELQDKVAVADDQALLALFDVLEAADAVLHNMESYYECLKAAQARLLNAFVQNQYLELDESAPNGIAD